MKKEDCVFGQARKVYLKLGYLLNTKAIKMYPRKYDVYELYPIKKTPGEYLFLQSKINKTKRELQNQNKLLKADIKNNINPAKIEERKEYINNLTKDLKIFQQKQKLI